MICESGMSYVGSAMRRRKLPGLSGTVATEIQTTLHMGEHETNGRSNLSKAEKVIGSQPMIFNHWLSECYENYPASRVDGNQT